jgi:hypothetical protein
MGHLHSIKSRFPVWLRQVRSQVSVGSVNEIDIVRDISRRFEQAGIAYMLTGSMAMNYYAQPRMTRDIDVVIAIQPEDIERVAALFRDAYYVNEENIREALAHETSFNPDSSRKRDQSRLHRAQKQRVPTGRV